MPILRRNLPVPLYHQLKHVLQRDIEAGRWKPGEQLPTENDLIARFRVSKITVRQALRELSHLGYIRREQGRGTFVQRPPLEEGPRELTSFTDEMRQHGLSAKSQVLEQGVIPASPEVAARLEIAPAAPVFRLRRLRFADREPMGLQTAYVAMASVPGICDLSFADASLYEVFRSRYNLYPASAKETHVAVLVNHDEAGLLQTTPGSPGFAAERMTYLSDGKPLEFVKSIMRGDRYRIVLDLVRPPPT
jgi:GntR family transcriptional regulator, N-acetylglucosamine utilization regulator